MPQQRSKWEYFHHWNKETFPKKLNELGQEGWELVSAVKNDDEIIFYFKRPIDIKLKLKELEQKTKELLNEQWEYENTTK